MLFPVMLSCLFALLSVAYSVTLPEFPPPPASSKPLIGPKSDGTAPILAGLGSGPIVQSGQWMYLSGHNFLTDVTKVVFDFAGTKLSVAAYMYDSNSLGVTVPATLGSNSGSIYVETPAGTSGTLPLFVAKPDGPPTISGFSAYSGSVGCYLYVSGGMDYGGLRRICFIFSVLFLI